MSWALPMCTFAMGRDSPRSEGSGYAHASSFASASPPLQVLELEVLLDPLSFCRRPFSLI